jgi:serine/threonine protein kinase
VRTIVTAVKHIHDSGVEHRDLNPKTLHFRSPADDAPLMIVDFGVSRMTETDQTRSGTDDGELEIYGAPRYMAPEIFSNRALSLTKISVVNVLSSEPG